MADEMEQIEARLAAYVDGTLPPEQRAEIEAYLQANPTHGRLIAELKSIKSAVMTLPKEKAPAEVLDTLQGHLERHTLLEGVEESIGSSRIQRWPQVGALAAVLLLAAGLGILVYQVLPQKKGAAPELALLPDSTQGTMLEETPSAGQGVGGGINFNDATNVPAAQPKLADAAPRSDRSRDLNEGAPGQQLYQNQFGSNQQQAGNAVAIPELKLDPIPYSVSKTFSAPSEALEGPTRILTITTDDPVITRALIASYFAQHQLAFERVAEEPVKAIAPAIAPISAAVPGTASGGAADDKVKGKDSVAEAQPNSTPPAAPSNASSNASSNSASNASSSLAQTPPAADLATKQAESEPAPASVRAPAGESIVVRRLSPAQLADVETSLIQQRPTRQQAIADWRHDALAATTAPSTQVAATAPSETVIFADAMAFKSEAATQPTTAPAATQSAAAPAVATNLIIRVIQASVPTTQPQVAPTTAPATLPVTPQ